MRSIVRREVRQRCACTARAPRRCGRRAAGDGSIGKSKFAHGCELVGV
jgi:hypothetical protein